ncbi:hypothetical protein [Microvirga calopogonii]|uniref:hypothetical protein n=1 Tax=Microvirga calopogonii TaxID=2078013 RepID=UPI0013B4278B|nr:hypothetical protein [Microvirga calopogonii]
MARPRILLPFVQALLGLILLACLPAIDHAKSEAPFLLQLEKTLSFSGLSDGGEGDGEVDPGTWKDGAGGSDALVPWGTASHAGSMTGQGIRLTSPQSGNAALPGSLRATGPPHL